MGEQVVSRVTGVRQTAGATPGHSARRHSHIYVEAACWYRWQLSMLLTLTFNLLYHISFAFHWCNIQSTHKLSNLTHKLGNLLFFANSILAKHNHTDGHLWFSCISVNICRNLVPLSHWTLTPLLNYVIFPNSFHFIGKVCKMVEVEH